MNSSTGSQWLLLPEKQLIEVYAADADIVIFTADDTLTGWTLLPGFTVAVRSLFP